jgi:uncharacterized protein YdeI (BOF family)
MRKSINSGNRPHSLSELKEYVVIRAALISLCAFVLAGCGWGGGTILGQAPNDQINTVATVRQSSGSAAITIRGTMIEKCPIAGCWFIVRDETGRIKVDTKAAGFVVVDVPLQANVVVSGRIVSDGSDPIIEATGLRYR